MYKNICQEINNLQNNTGEQDSDFILDETTETMTMEQLKALLERIKNEKLSTKRAVSANVFVKFNGDTSKLFETFNCYEEYGIIPMIPAEYSLLVKVKKEVYGISNEEQLKKLKGNEISGFVVDEKMIKFTEEKRYGIREIIENLISINEDTPERKYKKGLNAAMRMNSDYNVKDMQTLIDSNILSLDFRKIEEEKVLKFEIEKILNEKMFSYDATSYIEYQLSKENYTEVLGFIRGIVIKTVANDVGNILDIEKDTMIKDIQNNEVQAILIMTIQRMMNGEKLEKICEMSAGSDTLTVEDFLNGIRNKLNEKKDEILRQSEYKIEKIEKAKAITDFNEIPELLMDIYGRKVTISKGAEISANLLRNILAAA